MSNRQMNILRAHVKKPTQVVLHFEATDPMTHSNRFHPLTLLSHAPEMSLLSHAAHVHRDHHLAVIHLEKPNVLSNGAILGSTGFRRRDLS